MMDSNDQFDVPPLLFATGAVAFFGSTSVLTALFPNLSGSAILGISFGVLALVVLGWMKYIQLPPEDRVDSEFPRSYTRNREYHGYDIEVNVNESSLHAHHPNDIHRTVKAVAFDEGELIAAESNTLYAGKLPKTVLDAPLGEDNNGIPVGSQTREVLEDLYDDIIEYEATGSTENTEGADSALDVVFGVEK